MSFSQATQEWEDAGLLSGAKPIGSAPEYNSYGSIVPRPLEWFYTESTTVGLALSWKDGPWEVQYNRNVPLGPLSGKDAKASPSRRSRLREGQVQPRVATAEEGQAKDFDNYAAFFPLSPEGQAEVSRRVREDAERNVDKQEEAEALRVAKEVEQLEKAKATQELRAATTAKLKQHRLRQQGERLEYQVLRIGQACGQAWPTDEEVRAILKKDPRASGTVYGTHYAIHFHHKQMVATPVLLADAPGDTAQAELREPNPFAWRSTVTSTPTLPTQGQAGCSGEGEFPRAAGSFLKDQRRARKVVVEGQVSSSTDPVEAPAKEQSMATPAEAQVGVDERQSAPTRQHSV